MHDLRCALLLRSRMTNGAGAAQIERTDDVCAHRTGNTKNYLLPGEHTAVLRSSRSLIVDRAVRLKRQKDQMTTGVGASTRLSSELHSATSPPGGSVILQGRRSSLIRPNLPGPT